MARNMDTYCKNEGKRGISKNRFSSVLEARFNFFARNRFFASNGTMGEEHRVFLFAIVYAFKAVTVQALHRTIFAKVKQLSLLDRKYGIITEKIYQSFLGDDHWK